MIEITSNSTLLLLIIITIKIIIMICNKVIEIISTLSQQLNKVRVASVASPGAVRCCLKLEQQLLSKGNHDVYLADQFPGVGDVEGWVEVYQVG